ncbi:hypothetical protein [Catenibacterium sp.]|uniref:hypothetical protein n=1 Tax=Catenibacterium sp. TaxID=2049022 RepID=UPI003AB152E3
MAIPTSIKTLLSGDVVEWARIELKQTWDPAASLKTICAFANDLDNWAVDILLLLLLLECKRLMEDPFIR